jgi:hypothetical protein
MAYDDDDAIEIDSSIWRENRHIMDFSAPRQASVREIQIREANFYFFVDDVASFLHHGTPGTMAIR